MAQFVALRPDVDVSGAAMMAFLDGAGRYAPMLNKILVRNGIHRLKREDWAPQQRWLDSFREIAATIGENTLFAIGKKIPENAIWPPGVDTAHAALASIDVAYHMNHRIDGEPLFDPATGVMKEGIGHYHYHPGGDRGGVMVCDNPYPSEFDRGIITGTARMWKPAVEVTLDASKPTRKQGADACTYLVRW